jgi:hypothetical protein
MSVIVSSLLAGLAVGAVFYAFTLNNKSYVGTTAVHHIINPTTKHHHHPPTHSTPIHHQKITNRFYNPHYTHNLPGKYDTFHDFSDPSIYQEGKYYYPKNWHPAVHHNEMGVLPIHHHHHRLTREPLLKTIPSTHGAITGEIVGENHYRVSRRLSDPFGTYGRYDHQALPGGSWELGEVPMVKSWDDQYQQRHHGAHSRIIPIPHQDIQPGDVIPTNQSPFNTRNNPVSI